MGVIRWIVGGLAVSAGVFVFAAGPEEAARVAQDAWGNVGGVVSGVVDGARGSEMVCEPEGEQARVTSVGAYHSQLKSRARPHLLTQARAGAAFMGVDASVGIRNLEVVDAPTLLPRGEGEVTVTIRYQGRVSGYPWEDVEDRVTLSVVVEPQTSPEGLPSLSCSVGEVVRGW